MARYFNTTGPCHADKHFMLPPLGRLPEVQRFFDRQQYFVLHAPRQTGKTTAMRALAESLRAQGVAACWASLETARGIGELDASERIWLNAISDASRQLPEAWRAPDPAEHRQDDPGRRLWRYLTVWASRLPVPLVLLLDEADGVTGPALVSLLSQLRDGFMDRGVGRFPTSVALIGMRDLRDYLAQTKDGRALNAGSPFNISAGSLTLANFNAEEVGALLAQHTAETGQAFAPEAVAELHRLTDGQPYLVNALADLCVTDLVPDRRVAVSAADIDTAGQRMILARQSHIPNLGQRLKEPRVARIVQAALLGDDPHSVSFRGDDFQYVVDLGLLRHGPQGIEAANPICREVLIRELTHDMQSALAHLPWP